MSTSASMQEAYDTLLHRALRERHGPKPSSHRPRTSCEVCSNFGRTLRSLQATLLLVLGASCGPALSCGCGLPGRPPTTRAFLERGRGERSDAGTREDPGVRRPEKCFSPEVSARLARCPDASGNPSRADVMDAELAASAER